MQRGRCLVTDPETRLPVTIGLNGGGWVYWDECRLCGTRFNSRMGARGWHGHHARPPVPLGQLERHTPSPSERLEGEAQHRAMLHEPLAALPPGDRVAGRPERRGELVLRHPECLARTGEPV